MRRVAVLSDVHGNLPALEAVLGDVAREDVDALVCCGDVYEDGPFGDECRALLVQAGAVLLRGNADPEEIGWPLTHAAAVDGLGRVLFCHGSPRSEHEILTKVSPERRVAAAVGGVEPEVAVVVHGHTHVQYDRRVAGRRLVCPGSVGMPYEAQRGGFWALLGPEVAFRRTEYGAQHDWLPEVHDPDEISALFEAQAGA